MNCCRICGETKPTEEFRNLPYFTKYKKHKVLWCQQCQKLYMEYVREKQHHEKLRNMKPIFSVEFE